MHFLVTGGAGFIGSHLVDSLLLAKQSVTVLDDFSTGSRTNLPNSTDLTVIGKDAASVSAVDADQPVDAIAHLAALPSVAQSWEQVIQTHERNLTATLRLLEFAAKMNIPRFVFASSAAVYGDPFRVPVAESHPTIPESPYGLQKLASEHYGRLLAKNRGFTFISLRLFNVYGPRQFPASPYSGVISRFWSAMERSDSMTIYGDGHQTRDFVHVKDVAAAFVAALMIPIPEKSFACNIGSGKPTSINSLARLIQSKSVSNNAEFKFRALPPLAGDIKHSQADIGLARNRLQFRPTFSLTEGLATLCHDLRQSSPTAPSAEL